MKNSTQKITKSKIKNENNNELENMKNQLARAMADYANLQKRTNEERSTMFKLASISLMTRVLPIIDNLKQAQNHVNDSGIAIIIGQLETLAKEEGFEEINIKVGDTFDEKTSEAVDIVETLKEKDNNIISEVILTGWKYSDGTIVRHARVKVFKMREGEKKQ